MRGHRTFGHLLRAHHGEPSALTLLKRAGYHVWWGGKNHLVPAEHGFDAYCDVKFQPGASDYARWGHEPRPFAQSGNQADPSLPDWRGAPAVTPTTASTWEPFPPMVTTSIAIQTGR